MHRPILPIDLGGVDRNVFLVIGHARALLVGDTLDKFDEEVIAAIQLGSGKQYADILAITNKYVQIVDTSRTYSEYTLDETVVIEAIEHLNQQFKTLPDTVSTLVEDLWPEFGTECGFKNYLTLLEQEIERVKQDIDIDGGEVWQPLLSMLQDCFTSLHTAGKS